MSNKLDELLGLERLALVPTKDAAATTSAKLAASIAAGTPLVVDLAPSAIGSALSVQVGILGIVGWSIAGVVIAVGIWSVAAGPEAPPLPPPPAPEPRAVVTSSTSTVVVAAAEAPPKRARRVALKPAPKPAALPEPVVVASPAPAPNKPNLAEELSLVRRAQVELKRGVPAAALPLVLEHEAKFPKGALAEERWALKAIILCRLGRTEEGRREARSFLDAHPGSPQAPRVRSECQGE